MDIVTHAMLGGILASPFLADRPVLAAGFVLGSALPDLDAVSRAWGKRAFLWSHQTFTHSFFCQALVLALGWGIAWFGGPPAFGWLGTGLAAGMLFHVGLDFTNTLGVTLLAPFSRRRFRLDWLFFIDVPMLVACILTLVAMQLGVAATGGTALVFGLALSLYVALRGAIARRARRMAPAGTVSLIPSPFVPWRFHGFRRASDGARGVTFALDALTERVTVESACDILDADHRSAVVGLPEFRAMAALSPAYHVVAAVRTATGLTLECRDLRTGAVGTSFGDLTVEFDPAGGVRRLDFRV